MVNPTIKALVVLTFSHLAAAPGPANAVPGVRYLGSRVCQSCHKTIYDTYVRTAMGRSMTAAKVATAGKSDAWRVQVDSAPLKRRFEVFGKNGAVYQSESQLEGDVPVFSTTHELAYAVGSGVNGMSFIVQRDDHLFQAPLSFYSRTDKWDLSPGYESADHGFSRPIHIACLSCHAGRPRPVPQSNGMYMDPPFDELAIGCENCHGPGQLHVAAAVRRQPRAASMIVNPKRLAARLAEDICAGCHQAGDTRVLQPGKEHGDFRPGTPLSDTLAIFKLPFNKAARAGEDLLEHHSAMELSRCFEASKGTLSCLTCHNPHNIPSRASATAFYRSKCLTCHTDESCGLPLAQRSKGVPPNDCAACHMPKRPVSGISHSALTNHRIVRLNGQPLPDSAFRRTAIDPPGLVFWNRRGNEGALSPVVRLTAYGELMDRNPELREIYLATLDEAQRTMPRHPLVLAALGRKALFEMNSQSVEILRSALAAGSTAASTFLDLSEALSRQGATREAIETLKQGIVLDPYARELRKSLMLRLIANKDYDSARKAMQDYVSIFPEDSFVRGLLQKVELGPRNRLP